MPTPADSPRWSLVVEDDTPSLAAHRVTQDGGDRRYRAVSIQERGDDDGHFHLLIWDGPRPQADKPEDVVRRAIVGCDPRGAAVPGRAA